ncbi:hypothetical protein BGZ93_003308 [Podila epicladia]|nr:hypothetical protein BGZ92_009792 [Podila epicladia]KAG0097148.1 hypothetical protein BGZ93_003308 [Podila epicladia]
MSWFSPRRLATALLVLSLASSAFAVEITLTFYDADGNQLGNPQPITNDICTSIDETAFPNGFASVKASNPQAALNLYDQAYCPFVIRSAVGQWESSQVPGAIKAVRYEGTATNPPGTISEQGFPKGMVIQTKIPDPEGPQWVIDPAKATALIIIVSVILVIGVAIGVYQVYQAAQYKPPPKKPKKQTGLNTKKIKKKDAYFKKPMKDDEQSFQRLHNDSSPEPSQQMMERSRESQYSEGTYLDWTSRNNSQVNVSHANTNKPQRAQETSIDMRGTQSPMGNNRSYTPDLINFDSNNNNNHITNTYTNTNNNAYSNSYNNGFNNNQRGRGGEVLVPMHNLDYSQNQGRSAVRRSSRSRSR